MPCEECECIDNVSKEKYICTIFAVLFTLYVISRLNGFHKYNGFHVHCTYEYTGKNSKIKTVFKSAP